MQPTTDGLIADLKAMITGFFPDSHVSVGLSTIIGHTSIIVVFTYQTRADWPNGIIENGRGFHQFAISDSYRYSDSYKYGNLASGAVLPDKLSASCLQGGKVYAPNFTNGVKVGWRDKNKATPERVIMHMTAYFAKLKAAIVSHPDANEWNDS